MGIKEFGETKRVERLLDKYWKGECSELELQILKDYFAQPKVAEHLEYVKPLFQVLKQRNDIALGNQFDEKILERMEETPISGLKSNWMVTGFRVAASILMIVAATYLIYVNYFKEEESIALSDTYDDPEVAYAEFKKSMLFISEKLNKGTPYMNELEKINTGAKIFNAQKKSENEDQ